MSDAASAIRAACPGMSEEAAEKAAAHYALMLKWGKTHNLTRVSSLEEAVERHYQDSWFGLDVVERHVVQRAGVWVDVGTGAGFPGVVAAIRFPEQKIRLLDASRKRCSFLQTVVRELSLKHVSVEHGRAEDAAMADVVMSRATFSIDKGLDPALALVEPGGQVFLWAGNAPDQEGWKIMAAGFLDCERTEYELPTQGTRAVLSARKER